MITIKTTEPKILKFAIDIEGSQSTPSVRYIIEGKSFDYTFEGTLEAGSVRVEIPKLSDSISSGEHKSRIEVILDESYYNPWNGLVTVETPVEVKIQESIEEETILVEKKVAVKLTEETVKPVKKVKKIVETKKPFKKKPTKALLEDILDE